MRPHVLLCAVLLLALPTAAGCRGVYYDAMSALGQEKRDLLRSALEGMVDDQKEAEEAFTDALTRAKQLTGFEGGEMETVYDKLNGSYEDAVSAAEDIDDRTVEIDDVATDMFSEWEAELDQMTTKSLRDESARRLNDSRSRYKQLRRTLLASRANMEPVLAILKDHVLFLKHNLNAAALGSLGAAMGDIEGRIQGLQQQIQLSIREAQGFIRTME